MKRTLVLMMILMASVIVFWQCSGGKSETETAAIKKEGAAVESDWVVKPDTNLIPDDKFGEQVRYGRQLMLQTAYYIGPEGVAGRYTVNKMNCTNCHQDAGTKPYSFNLIMSHTRYPQYRAREGRVLSLAERVNNCVMRPHSGKPLPLDSKEMLAFLSYFKWINSQVPHDIELPKGEKNLQVAFPGRAADPVRGAQVYASRCERCHGANGEGKMLDGNVTYQYPPLWGATGYQPGSSMHRVIKQAQWLKANMPQDSATWQKPLLSDEDALDVAAFVNDDRIHQRPNPKTLDYPHANEKALDYGKGPFADTFSELQHKFGPYQPMIDYWKAKGWKPVY
jgi:thiosulfate dehydrogenase